MLFTSAFDFRGYWMRPLLAAIYAAIGGSIGIQTFTNANPTTVAIIAAIAAVGAALLASLPAILKELRERRAEREKFFREQIRYHSAVAAVVRVSKHKVFGELDTACKHIQYLERVLEREKIPLERAYRVKTQTEIIGDEDRRILELTTMNISGDLTESGERRLHDSMLNP